MRAREKAKVLSWNETSTIGSGGVQGVVVGFRGGVGGLPEVETALHSVPTSLDAWLAARPTASTRASWNVCIDNETSWQGRGGGEVR